MSHKEESQSDSQNKKLLKNSAGSSTSVKANMANKLGQAGLVTPITKVQPPQLLSPSKSQKLIFLDLQKYTVGSTGIWETIRRAFAVDPDRSTGIPLKHFRNPPPGSNEPENYDDPTTVPAADIADNPYWRRDVRRAYPKLSAVTQGDVVGLLTMGNAASPSEKLLRGEEGSKQLVAVKEEGEKGLATYFESEKGAAVLGEGGLPPLPVAFGRATNARYEVGEPAYKDKYVCTIYSKCCVYDSNLCPRYPCRNFV